MTDVAYTQLHEIAGPELAIDSQIEQCEISASTGDLESYANRPYLLELERGLLAYKLSLVPWLTSRIRGTSFQDWLLLVRSFQFAVPRLRRIELGMLSAETWQSSTGQFETFDR
jgi:hypothetical protein